MDLNVIIIQNVKNYPELYNRNRKLAEREKTWKFLAKSLKLDEIFLKSRWHILRERYVKQLQNELEGQQRNCFKYAKELEFIKQHIKLRAPTQLEGNIPHNWIKPEFVITAAELELQTENLQECKEIMFMEIEESSKEIVQNRTEVEESCLEVVEDEASQELEDVEDNCNRMIEDDCQEIEEKCNKVVETSEIEYISNEVEGNCNEVEGNCNEVDDSCQEIEKECNKVINDNQYKVQETKELQKNAIAKKKEASLDQAKEIAEAQTQQESPKLPTVKIEETDERKLTIVQNNAEIILKQEEPPIKKVIVEKIDKQDIVQKPVEIEQTTISSVESSTRTDTVAMQNPESPAKNIRCEDAIFGELIVAMLKSMDPVKKKSIKREIMNLLFS